MNNIIATCEAMICDFDRHMADTYDLPSALGEIISRCKAAEKRRAELQEWYDELARANATLEAEVKRLRSTNTTLALELCTLIDDITNLPREFTADTESVVAARNALDNIEL